MTWLILSVLALVAGPLFYGLATGTPARIRAIDGFVFVTVPGLILLDALPALAAQAGWLVFLWAAAGLFVPNLIETAFRPIAHSAHMATVWLAVIGLIVHTLVDGAALASATGGMHGNHPGAGHGPGHGEGLALAVVIHRLPVGLAVWWVARPAFGYRWATTLVLVMIAGTFAGYFAGAGLANLDLPELGIWFQALVAGAILHTVVFRPHLYSGAHDHSAQAPGTFGKFSGLGDLAGWLLLAVLLMLHSGGGHDAAHAHMDMGETWISRLIDLTLLSAPALVVAYVIGGLLSEYMPAASIRWTKKGGTLSQSFRGMAIGLPLPICSCGVVPLYRQLVSKGAPPAAAYAFLVATPELGIDALLLSIPLLGWEMSGFRVFSAAVVALLVGWAIGLWFQRSGMISQLQDSESSCEHEHEQDELKSHEHCCEHSGPRWKTALKEGCVELVDRTAPWILLGLVVAAVAEPWIAQIPLDEIPDGWEIFVCALIGMPIYICASGATPMVAGMIAAGVSPGAAIAFLLTGPATNVSTFGVIKSVHGKNVAMFFVVLMASASVAIGFLVNFLASGIDLTLPELFMADHAHGPVRIGAAIILVGLVLASIYRRGSRAFLKEIWA